MATDTPLTRELIADTTYVDLYIRLGIKRLDVMLYNPHEDHSLITRTFSLETPAGESPLKVLEDVIYDNPLLLADFRRTRVIAESTKLLIVPDALVAPEAYATTFALAHPDTSTATHTLCTAPIADLHASVIAGVDSPQVKFLQRTFNAVPVVPAIATLANYCRNSLSMGNTIKAFVNLRDDSLDIIVLSHERLLLANRFAYRTIDDAAYYVMAATDMPGVDIPEILLMGDRSVRDALMPILRRYRPYVMPMIFPSQMYRAGAAALNQPFDLTIMPLCE